MSFKGQIQVLLGWRWIDGAKDDDKLLHQKYILDPSGDLENKRVYHRENLTVMAGTPHLWDLTHLTRTIFGMQHVTLFEKVLYLMFENLSPRGSGTLIVGGATFNAWWMPFGAYDHTVEVGPQSPMVLANREGWDVSASSQSSSSSGDSDWDNVLQVAASVGSVEYSFAIIGEVANLEDSSSSSG